MPAIPPATILAIVRALPAVAGLIKQAIPALQEGATLIGQAVPGAHVSDLVQHGQEVANLLDPLAQAVKNFIAALESHKAAAATPPQK